MRQEDLRRSEFFRLPWVEEVRLFNHEPLDDMAEQVSFCRPLLFKKAYALPAKACSEADVSLSIE